MGRHSKQSIEVFVSHASKDQAFVKGLLKVLKQNKIRYWFSETTSPVRRSGMTKLGALSIAAIGFSSPNAVKSIWVKRELLYALRQNRYRGRIIPILFRDCQHELLSWTLADFEFVDFRKDFDIGCENLLRLWRR